MEPFFQSNYLETSVNADLEITKVTINRMELVVEDVEIANREPVKATGARTETQALQPMLLPAYLSGGAAYSFAPVHG